MGYNRMPDLAAAGVMLAGDAAGMVDALHREGTNLAMTAGRMAGETALAAHRQGDFSADFLKQYRRRLEESFVLKDLKQYRHDGFLDSTPIYGTYVNYLNEAALRYFTARHLKRDMEKEIVAMLLGTPFFLWRSQGYVKLLQGCEAEMKQRKQDSLRSGWQPVCTLTWMTCWQP
jgi:electron transfer flavoprotein-quinone oxidoreductase